MEYWEEDSADSVSLRCLIVYGSLANSMLSGRSAVKLYKQYDVQLPVEQFKQKQKPL